LTSWSTSEVLGIIVANPGDSLLHDRLICTQAKNPEIAFGAFADSDVMDFAT
jgi:hypothetical protein